MTLNYGVIRINDNFNIAPRKVQFSGDYDVTINQYPTDVVIGFSFGTTGRKLTLREVYFKTTTDAETFLSNIQTLHEAGTAYKVRHAINSTPTYFKFDGSQAYMEMFITKWTNLEAVPGYQEKYIIQQIVLMEAEKL